MLPTNGARVAHESPSAFEPLEVLSFDDQRQGAERIDASKAA
jgi:hypothetical protein